MIIDNINNVHLICDEIEELDISNINLMYLPELPTSLKKLNCSYNELTIIDLSYLIHLEELDCSFNYLINIKLPNNVIRLNCSQNKLSICDSNLNSLHFLDCSNNEINHLILNNYYNLIELKCNDNYINQLDFYGLNKLTIIYCNNNLLHTLGNIPDNITILECDNNPFPVKMIDILSSHISLTNKLITLLNDGYIYETNDYFLK
jgi:hypothetical protein